MDELSTIKKQAQEYCAKIPTMIIGSGASAAFGLSGMEGLASHLQDTVVPINDDKTVWNEICTLLKNSQDLESALSEKNLTENLRQQIINATWGLLNTQDIKTFNQSLQKYDYFALGSFLNYCFRTSHNKIEIITTNYDRLIEYACDQENLHWFTGFGHGYRNIQVNKDVLKANNISKEIVNIWKVHGSLGWYDINGEIVSLGNLEEKPENWIPCIVTPGQDKYQKAYNAPYRDIITASDKAIVESRAFLCIGFGFNDQHIQPKLIARCSKNEIPIIILTRTLTEATKKFLFKSENKPNNFIAIERNEEKEGSMIYSSKRGNPEEALIVTEDFWSLKEFLSIILRG